MGCGPMSIVFSIFSPPPPPSGCLRRDQTADISASDNRTLIGGLDSGALK